MCFDAIDTKNNETNELVGRRRPGPRYERYIGGKHYHFNSSSNHINSVNGNLAKYESLSATNSKPRTRYSKGDLGISQQDPDINEQTLYSLSIKRQQHNKLRIDEIG